MWSFMLVHWRIGVIAVIGRLHLFHPIRSTCSAHSVLSHRFAISDDRDDRDDAYSILNACVGSILQARSAGTALAMAAVKRRLAIMAAKTAGSTGRVP